MKKKLIILLVISIYFNSFSQNISREGVASVISALLFGNGYDFNDNPAINYPNPFIDLNINSTNGKKINIISRLDYGDGRSPFPFLNEGSSSFHPSGLMPRIGAVIAVVEAWNIPVTEDYSSPFNDVPDDYYLNPWLNAAYNAGIISGNNFNPFSPVQDDDILIWAREANNSPYGNVSKSILNDSKNYFLPHLYLPENLGMFKGLEQGVFSHYAKNSFVIPDIQMSLNFSHFYSTSMVELPESFFLNQPLGRGWSHTYNIFAQRQLVFLNGSNIGTELFHITWADGTIHTYNDEEEEWVTKGVYNNTRDYSRNGRHYLEVTTKNHSTYLFENLNDSYENYYLVKIIDKNSNTVEIEYEFADEKPWLRRIEKVIAPSGKELLFRYYSNSDRLREVEDPIGREIRFSYSSARLKKFTDAKENETKYFYVTDNFDKRFERFLLEEIELPRGNKIEATYEKNKDGYLSTYKINNNDPIKYDIDVDFDSSMPITVKMDVPMPDGNTDEHTSEYNSLGLLETFQSGTDDMVITYPSPSSSNPFLPNQVSNHNIDIAYLYDSRGNVEKIDYESGERIFEFDWSGQNNLNWTEDPRGKRTYYSYDDNHNLTQITDPLSKDINLEYFNNGNLKKITNQEGISIDFTYHSDGPLKTFVAPENISGSFLYDGINRLLSKTVNGLTSSYTYDDNDNILTFTNSGQNTTVFSYDSNDNVATIKNANQVNTIFTYHDDKDHLIQKKFDQLETNYSYNDDDTIDEVVKPSGQTIGVNYTSDGQYDGSGTVLDLQYDSNERVIRIETDDIEYQFEYDKLNQIDLVKITGKTRDVEYLYDSAGNISRIYYPNVGANAYVHYTYDDKNRLERLRAINFNNLPNTDIAEYTYLNDDRISQIEYGNGFITTYAYDEAGRPTGIKHEINGEVYYDELRTLNNRGNVLDLKLGYRATDTPIYQPTEDIQNFQYNNNNHINSSGFTVNNDGNTTASPIGTFTYDVDDQPRERIANGVTSQYQYDAFGNRTKRTESNNIDKEYLWDIIGKNTIQEYNVGSNDDPRSYVYGLGLEARIFNGIVTYYHGDLRGNVVLITDPDGNRGRDYQYSPFGKPTGVNPAYIPDHNEFTFLGKLGIIEDDRDAGLYYIRARYYDASIGRFITEDPMASSNLYVYGGNNPIKNIDRNGQFVETAADVVSLGASIYDFSSDPSLTNGLFLAWDIVGLVPGVPGSWSAKVLKKGVGYADEAIQGGAAVGKRVNTVSTTASFSSLKKAKEHYMKHVKGQIYKNGKWTRKQGGADMPEFNSFEEYLTAAKQFFNNGSGDVLTKIRSNGDILKFDISNGYFGVQNANGTMKTFFRPKNGLKYFNAQ
ncbi:RHS repeat-associated core domain-containing protein [Polaribacter sp. Z022]|uniref:RHS repeat-associated core domain-containing protein n=1 Tax=Polaribacter sp. Z022 TaxID=2927125 RepID=UPI0020210639|nr:RHS repeat-associated core domain-containing protein [Polaribacter sp. Z022]MCL7752441.1 hypothetical protein [Polaribacter sp. Z022]